MSDENITDRLLADLKKRFALGSLTYAEAVMVEDLIAAITEINSKPEVGPAEGAAGVGPSGLEETDRQLRTPKN